MCVFFFPSASILMEILSFILFYCVALVAPSHLSCVLWDGGCRNSDFFLSRLMTSWFELNRQLKSYLCSLEFVS